MNVLHYLLMASRWFFVMLCLLLCFGRLLVPHVVPSLPGTYEALAHVFCGLLLGLWIGRGVRFYLWCLLAITLFEAVAFFLTR